MDSSVIFHIDLNAFFVNAAILKNQQLVGQPVVVAGLHRRSVVSTASYEARACGIHAGMPLMMATNLCPDLVIVDGEYEWFEECSKSFFEFLKKYSPYMEIASIDECYLDVTRIIKQYKKPLDLAWRIQQEVLQCLKLPCSIGIAPNKFLAKMASDMRKPMGITVLRKNEIANKLWVLPIDQMWGIGKKSVPRLTENGILTIGDLANIENEQKVMQLLGKHAYSSIINARGEGLAQLQYSRSVQSISQGTTLDNDTNDYEEIKTTFTRLSKALATRCKEENVKGKLISITIRYHDFRNAIRSCSLDNYIDDQTTILEQALYLFDKHDEGVPLRHLGITLGSLYSNKKSIQQYSLFQEIESMDETDKILNQLNSRLSKPTLKRGSQASLKKAKKKLS